MTLPVTYTFPDYANPVNLLINISESALASILPAQLDSVVANAQKYLRRVYPRGTRVASGNLNPFKFWRAGSHFTALNWQEFDMGMQLNEAMFSNTGGWALKPGFLRGVPNEESRKVKLTIDIAGISARTYHSIADLLSSEVVGSSTSKGNR